MSTVNTFADVILHQNNGQPIVLPFLTTGHQAFQIGLAPAVLTFPAAMIPINTNVGYPGRAPSAISVTMIAAGTMTLGRGVTYQVDINQGLNLTPAIASTGAIISPTGAGLYNDNWYLEIDGMWDSTSLNFRGVYYGWAGGTSISQTALVLSSPATLAALQFNVGVTVTNLNAANTFSLTEFSVDLN